MQQQTEQASSSTQRPLWLAVGVLAVAVAGLGGTLLGMQLPGSVSAQGASLEHQAAQAATAALVPFDGPERAAATAPARAAAVPARPATPVRAQPQPVAGAACRDCGTVVSVAPVQRGAAPIGVGAVAGGVVGGVLGNQIGGGSGRALATVAGAVGGGWAGHEVEKRVRQTTQYLVRIRMDDGSVQTVEQAQPVGVGSSVRVQGGVAQAYQRPVLVRG